MLFSFNWWVLLILTIVPWLVWWKVVDRKRIVEIFFYGSLVSIHSILLDDIGSYFLLWIYKYQLVPINPRLNPIDLTIMPVTYMFVYQYFNKWKTFLVAQMILALGATFLAEPLFMWMDIYKPLKWKLYYSVPIYFGLGLLNKWFMGKLLKKQFNY
ncbi:CBO0543 family protein [Neobacillus pocheonensis]|uniref:CBO0543 family protein n=1 Tax=Neobacillus pocheonensis TaxID=363869 RepID=UPI003D26FEF0